MIEINSKIKSKVFYHLISSSNFLGKYEEYDGILTFLNKIWNLKEMPSEDDRFKNAYDDAYQHLVRNSDWSMEYLFIDRFNLINGDNENFNKFIETIVHPTVRTNKNEIIRFVDEINSIISVSGIRLILTSYFEDYPVYKLGNQSENLPIDIVENTVPIYLEQPRKKYTFPCFELTYDNWDDYGNKTAFGLNYFSSASNKIQIGWLKIMKRETPKTWDSLEKKFTKLSNDYCSVSSSDEYYFKLKEILGSNFSSFLLALRDVAFFPKVYESFENEHIFRVSLIRDNDTERIIRTIRFEMEGISQDEYFKFNYKVKPPYSKKEIVLNFDFDYNSEFEHRIYALIGKNGTGKTRILSTLASDLSHNQSQFFSPRKPLYGKVFTVSYSFFDKFEIPNSDAAFNYIYCGLKKNKTSYKTENELLDEFYQSADKIIERGFYEDWITILENFLSDEILKQIDFKKIKVGYGNLKEVFDREEFLKIESKLSSGENIILYLLSRVLANIRLDSLILFDEPETHLHPNAISALINTLFELVRTFESFCIIATHSPIIIQEISARNIFVIEREDSEAYVRKLERESFGENLTIITQEIFGNRDVARHFVTILRELVERKKTYDEICSILESKSLPITSNIKLYIKALISEA